MAAVAGCTAGCTTEVSYFLPEPFPLGLDGGALVSQAAINRNDAGDDASFNIVIDTGSPVTVWDDHQNHTALETQRLRLFDVNGVPRLDLVDVRLYVTPLRTLGLDAFPVGGVLGGDNLQRWVLGLDYRGGPKLTVLDDLTPCNCALARDCNAVFPFTLAGGGQDRPLTIGSDVISYPATRILLDVCLEPYSDPLSTPDGGTPCATTAGGDVADILSPAYLPSGVDARLIVSTGFPGFALSSSMFAQLRDLDPNASPLPAPTAQLHLPDPADDGADSSGLTVGTASLGRSGVAAMVIVDHQGYLGPCEELARSRRQRRNPLDTPRSGENGCFLETVCSNSSNSACSDNTSKDHVSALLELDDPVPTFVMLDTAPLLVGINADVRPGSATVDGIIGTEVLRRFVSSIDYPGRRLVARCTAATGCLTYPAYRNPAALGSGCQNDDDCQLPGDIPDNGGLCAAAPSP